MFTEGTKDKYPPPCDLDLGLVLGKGGWANCGVGKGEKGSKLQGQKNAQEEVKTLM